jgi:hypothetical protein
MNLAWLAAVLQPRDVAAHPNFRDVDYGGDPSRLAALVLGGEWYRHIQPIRNGEYDESDPVDMAERCLRADSIALGVAALARFLTSRRQSDPAQATALTLILCSAASELDDYQTCFRVLDDQLNRITDTKHADYSLLRAALLQQRALRSRDIGEDYLTALGNVVANLSRLDITECTPFLVSPGVSWSWQTTLREIRRTLLSAASSLVPLESEDSAKALGLPTWQQRVRAPANKTLLRLKAGRVSEYEKLVAQTFQDQFATQARSADERGYPDFFNSLLGLELLGHDEVYSARRELALLRLVQHGPDSPVDAADALRLLRHAGAKNEIDTALRRIQAAGPLSVLSQDARQILRMRTAPTLLRSVELRVLRVAAELLAPSEARVGLDAIIETLDGDGPPNLPGSWELPLLRRATAWSAAVALGNACGAEDEAASLLLREAARQPKDDQLLDRSLLRASIDIVWVKVSRRVTDAWTAFLRDHRDLLPGTAERIFNSIGVEPLFNSIGVEPRPAANETDLDSLVTALNRSINAHEQIDPVTVRDGVSLVTELLARKRADADRGSYSMGAVSVSDAGAALLTEAGASELWPELTRFLLDPAVSRDDRTPPLERLARADLVLPRFIEERFRNSAEQLLQSSSPHLFIDTGIVPYPAALRFLARHGLLDSVEADDALSTLAGASTAATRREAAITVALLISARPENQLVAFALSLARDEDVEVRAHAGRALAIIAGRGDQAADAAARRLIGLLSDDGLLAPLLILQELTDLPSGLPNSVRSQIVKLAADHPSRSVREAARRAAGLDPPAFDAGRD